MENCCLKTLIEKFRNKDMSAFPVIFAEFEGLIRHYTLKCSAEDTFQELTVFLLELLYKVDISRFEDKQGDGLKRYIAVCLGNKYIALSKEDCLFKSNTQLFEDIASQTPDFLEEQALREAMDKLTEKQKEVMIFKYVHNYTNNEIAEILNISRQAVNQIKNRAVEILRGYLV